MDAPVRPGLRWVRFSSERERGRVAAWCAVSAALGWLVLYSSFELLLGPHVQLLRSVALASGTGAVAGLITSALQWVVLRRRMRGAGALLPVATAAYTLAAVIAGFLLYALNHTLELYRWNIPLQGSAGAVFVGVVTARLQWTVWRQWAEAGPGWTTWLASTAAGSALSVATACASLVLLFGLFADIADGRLWPYIMIFGNLLAGMAGAIVYGCFISWGLKRVLPPADEPMRAKGR